MKNFRLAALTTVGLLLLAPMVRAATASQSQSESKKPAQEQKKEKWVRARWDMADGQIKDVTCKGRAMDMTFYDDDEALHLHTDNYFKVRFSAINYTPKGKMNPCKTAKGMYARVYYYRVKGHPKEGRLVSVEFRK